MLQGQTRPDDRRPHDPVGAGAGGRRAAGRVLRARCRATTQPQLKLLASYASGGQASLGKSVGARRGTGRPVRAREAARSCSTNVPRDYMRIVSGLGERAAADILVLPLIFEGQVERRARAGVVRGLQPDAPGLPRPAHRIDRHRAQHDRSQHAHRGPAQAVAVARPGAAEPAGGAADRPTRSCRRRRGCWPSRTRKWNARTRKSSRPARRSKRRPSSWRSRRSTSRSSWPTCRTSCARRSTAC